MTSTPDTLGGHATVDLDDVVVRYRRRTALDGVGLHLGPGVHGLLGPNGAGKSTLVRVAAGKSTLVRVAATVTTPASGTVRLAGHDSSTSAEATLARRRLGYLPQAFGFYPRFTVREFVEYFAWLKQVPARRLPVAVQRAIDRVDLASRADDRLRRLSGGMIRRVGIAQAIVNDPDVLLLDEPTAGLDPEQRLDFRDLIRELGVDTCVVVSTHLVEDVAAACDDVTLLREGHVVFTGTPDELVAQATDGAPGDSPVERGYTSVLRAARASRT
jgi:ABC-2 type transport system ATP-binding protein